MNKISIGLTAQIFDITWKHINHNEKKEIQKQSRYRK